MRKPTTPIRVDRELNRRLHAAAADRDVSVAWLANRLIAEGLDNLTGGEVVLTQGRDVDAAARLRAEALEMRAAIAAVCTDEQMVAISNHMDRWAAAAVGSVDPEGERPEGWSTVESDGQRIWVQATDPARPSVCPTCWSDDPMRLEQPCQDRDLGMSPVHDGPDDWHSPDRGDR